MDISQWCGLALDDGALCVHRLDVHHIAYFKNSNCIFVHIREYA